MQQVKRIKLTEKTAVTENDINISGKFCYTKELKYNCVKLGTIVFSTSTASGQTKAQRVLRVDRQILRVNKQVLLVDKWLLQVGEEYYE